MCRGKLYCMVKRAFAVPCVCLTEKTVAEQQLLYITRCGGLLPSIWINVEVYFPDASREPELWDFLLKNHESIPLVPYKKYDGWSWARITFPEDGGEILLTNNYCKNKLIKSKRKDVHTVEGAAPHSVSGL